MTTVHSSKETCLVIGGTGKIGRRVVDRLRDRGQVEVRVGSRSAQPAFDWHEPATWDAALDGISTAYIAYLPDLVVTGAEDAIRAFTELAVAKGVQRLVLLSGRGEEEGYGCERIVQDSGVEWTVIRAGWFMQNFTEGDFEAMVNDGVIALPARDIPEPFVDVEDIADVVVAALTEQGHDGELYEVTGPRALTFTELASELSAHIGRDISFMQVPIEMLAPELEKAGVPEDVIWLMGYLFGTVLDGRNAKPADGVQRALGRAPCDFADFAKQAVASGAWRTTDKVA